MAIEQDAPSSGLSLFLARFGPSSPQQTLGHIVRCAGYFDAVEPDELLPVPRAHIGDYGTGREAAIIAALGRFAE
jgi:hypothetical protein